MTIFVNWLLRYVYYFACPILDLNKIPASNYVWEYTNNMQSDKAE